MASFLLVLQRYSNTCLSLNRSRLCDETKSVPFISKAVVSHQLGNKETLSELDSPATSP